MRKSNPTSHEQNLGTAPVNMVIADKSRKKQQGMSTIDRNPQSLAFKPRVIHHLWAIPTHL